MGEGAFQAQETAGTMALRQAPAWGDGELEWKGQWGKAMARPQVLGEGFGLYFKYTGNHGGHLSEGMTSDTDRSCIYSFCSLEGYSDTMLSSKSSNTVSSEIQGGGSFPSCSFIQDSRCLYSL